MSEFEDDVAITPQALDAAVPEDGFTIKGKVFQLDVNTVFWNDEDVPASYGIMTEEGESISIGLDQSDYFPEPPSLAEAILGALEEKEFGSEDRVLPRSLFTPDELKLIYESLTRKAESLRSKELSRVLTFEHDVARFKDVIEGLPRDHVAELEARLKGA